MKNKGVAVLLAFFLGGFGVHKFYLGKNVAGLLYLFFCWTYIPSILAIFDFIGLLLTSEASFNQTYNQKYLVESPYQLESSREKAAALMELKKLYDLGIITAEEFEQKRRKILDSI